MSERPRCACGYLAASHEGLRWHWSQKWCQYGGEPARVSFADLGLETTRDPDPVRQERVEMWAFEFGDRNFGRYATLDYALDELCDLIRDEARSRGPIPRVQISRVFTWIPVDGDKKSG